MSRPAALVAALVAALAFAVPAAAETVTSQDADGRTIAFDVQAPSVDVEWYADLLRRALHGDEIESVTVRVVPWADIQWQCGAGAAACYSARGGTGVIVVAAGKSPTVAATLIHEYGHHVDATRPVDGVREPNGTPAWWAARGIEELFAAGEVARDYRLGWDRSIGEVFAEDYVQLHMAAPYGIHWLEPPSDAVKQAIAADLGSELPEAIVPGGPTAEPDPELEPPRQPLVVVRTGRLRPGDRRSLPFTLLGPGRRVTFTVRVTRSRRPADRIRMELVCNGRLTQAKVLRRGRLRATIDRKNLGPAECEIALRSVSANAHRYVVRLRLAVES